MPHVVTQSCCGDASCVYACPVNCIHPTPDEPDFLTSDMLYIDPVACVDPLGHDHRPRFRAEAGHDGLGQEALRAGLHEDELLAATVED